MSMSGPFDPVQPGQETPVDGRDDDELEVEERRAADRPADAADSPVPDDAAAPVFRRPRAGDTLHPEDLAGE